MHDSVSQKLKHTCNGRFPISRLNLKTLSYDFVTRQARLLSDMGPHYTCL